MDNGYYIRLLEDSIRRKIQTVPNHMFVYNEVRGWNECRVECLFSYEYKQPNGGIVVLANKFSRIIDDNGDRYIWSDMYGKLFDARKEFEKNSIVWGGIASFSSYETMLEWIDKSLCSYDEHLTYVNDSTKDVIKKYGKYIKKGKYFSDVAVAEDCVFKIASDIKHKCGEYGLVFYVDVEMYDIDYKNSSIVKREKSYYDEPCVERLEGIKGSMIKDVASFIEGVRAIKIEELDKRINILMRQKERLLPNKTN